MSFIIRHSISSCSIEYLQFNPMVFMLSLNSKCNMHFILNYWHYYIVFKLEIEIFQENIWMIVSCILTQNKNKIQIE